MKKGIHANIYRSNSGEFSGGGISARCGTVTVIGAGYEGSFVPSKGAPAVKLVTRRIAGLEYKHLEPVEAPAPGNAGWMFGGTYVASSDARFPHDYPLPLHDRQEKSGDYTVLSN